VVLDMAILVESHLGRIDPAHSYSRVVVVEAPEALRVERAVARGMREADVRARIASQATDAERRAVADVVVANDTDLHALGEQVDACWAQVRAWAAAQGQQV
jgi:dephospho-CoA kinase